MLENQARVLILGDWMSLFSYAVFDGKNLTLELFEENLSVYLQKNTRV